MNKFVKWGLIGYGALVVAKGIEIAVKGSKLASVPVENVHGYMVLRDTGVMKAQGMKVASAMVFTDGRQHIVVDDEFFLLPVTVQRAVLAHEEGHIKLGHLNNITATNNVKRSLIAVTGGVQDIELEADRYASSVVGEAVMVNALYHLLKVKGVNKKEIRLRILALKSVI